MTEAAVDEAQEMTPTEATAALQAFAPQCESEAKLKSILEQKANVNLFQVLWGHRST